MPVAGAGSGAAACSACTAAARWAPVASWPRRDWARSRAARRAGPARRRGGWREPVCRRGRARAGRGPARLGPPPPCGQHPLVLEAPARSGTRRAPRTAGRTAGSPWRCRGRAGRSRRASVGAYRRQATTTPDSTMRAPPSRRMSELLSCLGFSLPCSTSGGFRWMASDGEHDPDGDTERRRRTMPGTAHGRRAS